MNLALQVGPLVMPYALLLVFTAVSVAIFLGARFGRALGVPLEPSIYRCLLVGFVAARLAFVWQFRNAYMDAPLDILDIRDGGWNALAGCFAAWLYALHLALRRPALKKPLVKALGGGTALWFVGSLALLTLSHTEKSLPSLTLAGLDGLPVQLDSFKGKPTVINVWATWCPPCVREMPVLQRAQQELRAVNFVFLNQAEPAAHVAKWLAARSFSLENVLMDKKGEAASSFAQAALPTTYFFNAAGKLIDIKVGALSHATLLQQIEVIESSK